MKKIIFDAGSFRDPAGSVFFYDDRVYRTVSTKITDSIAKLINSNFFKKFVANGQVIDTKIIKNLSSFDFYKSLKKNQLILEHKKIPFMTYPYEWSFQMLKDAALLTLDLMKECLDAGFILKDGTAWNITLVEGKMCFFDTLSITDYKEGQPWYGYMQFCQEFLYPLLLKSYKGIDFQDFFKGSMQGVKLAVAHKFFNVFDWHKPGVLKHVIINAKLSNSTKISKAKLKDSLKIPKSSIYNLVNNLYKVVSKLNPDNNKSIWQNYSNDNTYKDSDTKNKEKFINSTLDNFKDITSVIDLGCNTGNYSKLAQQKAIVVSCDLDSACIDKLYIQNKLNKINGYPLVLDLMNPSSSCGWNLEERSSIYDRVKVDIFMALALIHHICISSNVPLGKFINFLSCIAKEGGVLEWVDKKDPMVQFLLRNREDIFDDYTWENCKNLLEKKFQIENIQEINNGARKLCLLKKK